MHKFAQAIIAWQKQHGRHHLPWQNTVDPYAIWVSEIMLQQTQVAAVIGYYAKFMHVRLCYFDCLGATWKFGGLNKFRIKI